MTKRTIIRSLIFATLGLGALAVAPDEADAAIVRRVAPVRRVATRAALPPYPVARRAVVGPVVGPVVAPVRRVYRPVVAAPRYGAVYGSSVYTPVYGAPAYYGGGVSVSVGW